jgi:hypothetical protein
MHTGIHTPCKPDSVKALIAGVLFLKCTRATMSGTIHSSYLIVIYMYVLGNNSKEHWPMPNEKHAKRHLNSYQVQIHFDLKLEQVLGDNTRVAGIGFFQSISTRNAGLQILDLRVLNRVSNLCKP